MDRRPASWAAIAGLLVAWVVAGSGGSTRVFEITVVLLVTALGALATYRWWSRAPQPAG